MAVSVRCQALLLLWGCRESATLERSVSVSANGRLAMRLTGRLNWLQFESGNFARHNHIAPFKGSEGNISHLQGF